jgi:hypothetical protein
MIIDYKEVTQKVHLFQGYLTEKLPIFAGGQPLKK